MFLEALMTLSLYYYSDFPDGFGQNFDNKNIFTVL